MIKFSFQQMIAIFLFFLFGSVIFGISLRKLNQIERGNNRVAFRERPEFIFYDDVPYRYPRRSIDINLPQINVPPPPTTAPTTAPITAPTTESDTYGDEALARGIARSLDGEIGTKEFHRLQRESRDGSGSGDSGPAIVGGVFRRRREGFTNNIEGYMNPSSPLSGSPF